MEEPRKAYYAVIPADVRYDKDLPANAKLLYGEITALCNERGYCWASNEYFAGLYNTSTRSITRWVEALANKGYINTEVIRKTENEKIISKRLIIVGDKNVYVDKIVKSDRQKCLGLVDESVQYNNTFNNTFNNICPSDDERPLDDTKKVNPEEQLAEDFELIWKLYPRKAGKGEAFLHYKSWIKGKKYAGKTVKLTNRQMWYAVKRYADEVKKEETDTQFIKMGSTFFNGAIIEYVKEDD